MPGLGKVRYGGQASRQAGGRSSRLFWPGWLLSRLLGRLWWPVCQQYRGELSAQMMHGRGLGRQLVVGHRLRRRQPLRPLLPSPTEEALPRGGGGGGSTSSSSYRPAGRGSLSEHLVHVWHRGSLRPEGILCIPGISVSVGDHHDGWPQER